MTQNEPTTAHLLAGAAGMVMLLRQVIEQTDRSDPHHVAKSFEVLHDHLAAVGGSVAIVADMLGCKDEVERLIREGRERVAAAQACAGLGGRA